MSVFFGVRSTRTAIEETETPGEYGVLNSAAAKIFGARSISQNGAERPGVHPRTPYSGDLLLVHPYFPHCFEMKKGQTMRRIALQTQGAAMDGVVTTMCECVRSEM